MEEKAVSIWKSSMNYGIYLGIISILLSVIIWAGGIMEKMGIFGSAIIGLISLLITFIALFIFTKIYRNKEVGGYISFGHAFKFAFLVVVFSIIISSIYNYIFYTVIDPDYMKNMMLMLQEKTQQYMQKVGAPESQIEKTMEKFEEIPSIWKTLRQGVIYGIVGGGIISLIVAAIVKKKEDSSIVY
jgi:hypothetical protein